MHQLTYITQQALYLVLIASAPPILMSLEESLDFLNSDELLEVTPAALRLRKRHLTIEARSKAKIGK